MIVVYTPVVLQMIILTSHHNCNLVLAICFQSQMPRHFNEIHELWCSKTAKSVLLVKEGIDREKNLT